VSNKFATDVEPCMKGANRFTWSKNFP